MSTPGPADLQHWSEQVARDPGSPAFLPLARAYRRQGRHDAALRVCLRGLERNPSHLEAHGLLALLYLEAGDRERASDEWSIVLRLQPQDFDAHRGMGFYDLERGEYAGARRHLESAASLRPADPAVREALELLARRDGAAAASAPPGAPAAPASPSPAAPAPHAPAPHAPAPHAARSAGRAGADVAPRDPNRIFEALLDEAPFIGALVLDDQGLVLAGTVRGGAGMEATGAILGGAIDEAGRTASLLGLGEWKGILLEAEEAMLHLAPLGRGLAVLIAVSRSAPTGWVLRAAARAERLARSYLEEVV